MSKSVKWLLRVIACVLAVFVLMGSAVYIYDPIMYYRIPKDRLLIDNTTFCGAGIAKNAEYDCVIIGSSMTQNFDIALANEYLGCNAVKISKGGLRVGGYEFIMKYVASFGKAKKYIFDVNLTMLNDPADYLQSNPEYLYDDNKINDVNYLLGYETWLRFMPLELGMNILDKFGFPVLDYYGIDSIYKIGEDYTDTTVRGEQIKNDYLQNVNQVSVPNQRGMTERMRENADRYIDMLLEYGNGAQINVFFPAYSQLYWHQAEQKGYMNQLLEVKEYMVERLSGEENITVFDFHIMPQTLELDNYVDITHYNRELSNLMLKAIANGEYAVNADDIKGNREKLNNLVDKFESVNSEWLSAN